MCAGDWVEPLTRTRHVCSPRRGARSQSHFREEIRKLRLQGLINRMRFPQLASGKAILHRQPPGWWIGPFQFRWQEIMQKEDKRPLGPRLVSCNYPVHYRKLVFYSERLYFFFPIYLCHCYVNLIVLICTKVLGKSSAGLWLGLESYSFLSRRPQSDRLVGTALFCPGNVSVGSFFQNRSHGEDIGPRAWGADVPLTDCFP